MKKIEIKSLGKSDLTPEEEAEFNKIINETEKEIEGKSQRKTKPVTIRFSVADLERIKIIAEKKGIPYQIYIKSILKQALDKEDAA